MKIGDIIAKMIKKEELTAEETKFLETYKEPEAKKPENSVSQKEFDKVKAERDALQAKADEAANAGKTEAEKLQSALDKAKADLKTALGERDAALSAKSGLEYDNAVSTLAAEHKFTSRDYLKYKLQAAKIDIKDADAVKTFMDSLKKDEAKFFAADIKPGAGPEPAPKAPVPETKAEPGDRVGNIMKSLAEAQEVK